MRKLLVLALGLVIVAGAGAVAYVKLRAEPEAEVPWSEKSYQDIERSEMELRMQAIGYTE